MNSTISSPRFSVRQLALLVVLYSVLFTILTALPITAIHVLTTSWMVTLFVIGDWLLGRSDPKIVPFLVRVIQKLAVLLTSLALATLACFAVWAADTNSIAVDAEPQAIAAAFLITFAALSTIAFLASILASQHYALAMGLTFLNTPGVALLGFILFVTWRGNFLHG
jgi:hypothetical protein